MKLAIHKRAGGKKGETKMLRREGNIPAVLYGKEKAGIAVHVRSEEIQAILRNMKPGVLATTVFQLHDGQHTHKAVIKDIQYHVASYDVLHIDFLALSDDQPVSINVPIRMVGVADCAGVKLGGFLRQVQRTLKVSCLPKNIPQEFTVDVKDLNIAQSIRLADITLPANVRPMARLTEVAVILGKKAGA
jgi:large subunit ribosomal protein L25